MSPTWLAFAVLMVLAATIDLRCYRIPNWISVGLLCVFTIAALGGGLTLADVTIHALLAMAALVTGYLLYTFTGMGAGDAKLGAAALLWAGLQGLYTWTFFFALSMAVLALSLLVARWMLVMAGRSDGVVRVLRPGAPVPLGVALAAASLLASGSFNPALW